MHVLGLLLVVYTFHLPAREWADSTCSEAKAACTDLESCYVMQQVRWEPERVLWRTYQRGQEGALKTVNLPDGLEAAYWVETADLLGNRVRWTGGTCGPNVVQVGGGVGVPIGGEPPGGPLESERWYDVAGRRVAPGMAGRYWSSWRRRWVVLR